MQMCTALPRLAEEQKQPEYPPTDKWWNTRGPCKQQTGEQSAGRVTAGWDLKRTKGKMPVTEDLTFHNPT